MEEGKVREWDSEARREGKLWVDDGVLGIQIAIHSFRNQHVGYRGQVVSK